MVIAIIGILAALLLPALSRAKASARAAKCKSSLHQLGLALHMYVDENHTYPDYDREGMIDGVYVGRIHWATALERYSPLAWTNAGYHCPGYKGTNYLSRPGEFYRPSFGSYAYNAGGVLNLPIMTTTQPQLFLGLGSDQLAGGHGPPVTETQVNAPSEMFAIVESRAETAANVNPQWVGWGWDFGICSFPERDGTAGWSSPPRHGKNYNVLFCDGHVSVMDPNVLFDVSKTAANWNNDHQQHSEVWDSWP